MDGGRSREREGRDIYTEDGIRKINRGYIYWTVHRYINLHSMASFPLSLSTNLANNIQNDVVTGTEKLGLVAPSSRKWSWVRMLMNGDCGRGRRWEYKGKGGGVWSGLHTILSLFLAYLQFILPLSSLCPPFVLTLSSLLSLWSAPTMSSPFSVR